MPRNEYPKPIYELTADERFKYFVTFGEHEYQSREDEVIDFLSTKFVGPGEIEYKLDRVRTEGFGRIGVGSIVQLAGYTAEEAANKTSKAEQILETIKEVMTIRER